MYKNKDIKYQNNKKKKLKSTVQHTNSDKNSIDEKDSNIIPGLQDHDRPVSSSEVDVYSMNSTITSE